MIKVICVSFKFKKRALENILYKSKYVTSRLMERDFDAFYDKI